MERIVLDKPEAGSGNYWLLVSTKVTNPGSKNVTVLERQVTLTVDGNVIAPDKEAIDAAERQNKGKGFGDVLGASIKSAGSETRISVFRVPENGQDFTLSLKEEKSSNELAAPVKLTSQVAQAPVPPTRTPPPPPPTSTPLPDKAQATYLDPRELVADPKRFVGSNIFVQGKALTVQQQNDYTWVQVLAEVSGKSITESIVVEVRPKQSGILNEECYRFYGVVKGTQKVKLTFTGAETEVPLIHAYAFESSPAAQFGGCDAP